MLVFPILFLITCFGFSQSKIHTSFKESTVIFDENKLTVNTGKFVREWKITSFGMVTTSVRNLETGYEWVNVDSNICDWSYYGLIDEDSKADLVSLDAVQCNDEGFTSDHILVTAEFEYPAIETFLKYEVRVYPGSEGVFTRVSLKGNASDYITYEPVPLGIAFDLVTGSERYDYAKHGFTTDYIANYAYDEERIEYLIDGLDRDKLYKVGMSWWDYHASGTVQSVRVSGVDGETVREVVTSGNVPSFKDGHEPLEVVFELPGEVLMDGSFRLIVDKLTGHRALLSEIWILEHSEAHINIAGNVDRVELLRDATPDGWSLAGYNNCGERNRIETESITGRVDFVPVNATGMTRRYVGYYNDTQHRNSHNTPLIREEIASEPLSHNENNTWASVLFAEDGSDVLIMVKESHKSVNQYGHDTGDFDVSPMGIANTGTSLMPDEILPDRYRNAWATWVIASRNGDDERELAIKQFERFRYPVNPDTDIYIIANTWGSDRGIDAATEANVKVELASQHYLGIDVQQIDDGFQKNLDGEFDGKWYPHTERFPSGFVPVREKADSLGLDLGLWFAAQPVTLQEMKDNYDVGRFSTYKLDFANIRNHDHIESMIEKVRSYILYTNHQSSVNWDVTENAPRFGYFWAKEYGAVYLENRKPEFPENVVYVPYLVLRDLWHLSKYCNLNKFQGTVQNIDMVDKKASDANLHNHPYSVAIPLMSTPLFFQETQFYSPEAKEEVKEVLSVYKSVRKDIYDCIVYPIGSEPDNASWSGFQAHHPDKDSGFITLFREIENTESNKNIQLRFMKDKRIGFTNLMTGEQVVSNVDSNGFVNFEIEESADFLFLKYAY